MDVKLTTRGFVIVNFICQPDWAMRCPDIWLNILLCVSLRVFLGEINSELVDSVTQITFSNVCGSHPIHCRPEEKNKCWVREKSLFLPAFKLGHWFSVAFGLRLRLEITPLALLFLRPLDSDYNNSSPESLTCWLQMLGHVSLYNHVSQLLIINLSLPTHTHTRTLVHTHIPYS